MDKLTKQQDIKGFIRRRKKIFLFVLSLCFIIATGVAFYLPPIYRSQAVISIENQEIPEEYVKSTITSYAEERLKMTQQKAMSRSKLLDIIKDNNLYPQINSPGKMLRQMRKDIELETVDAAITDSRTGRTKLATVAFNLSYQGADQETVHKVAQTLANLFMAEDVRTRQTMASTTTGFFQKELESLKVDVLEFENKIRKFKEKNLAALPGSMNLNLQAISQRESELDRINSQIRIMNEKKIHLGSQITTVDPLMPVMTDDGKMASNPVERLKNLRLRLMRMQALVSPKHPDIKALKKEIAQLEMQVGLEDTGAEKVKQLAHLQNELSQLKTRLGNKHPDVVRLSKQVSALRKEVENRGAGNTAPAMTSYSNQNPDNPVYMDLTAKIAVNDAELRALYADRRKIKLKLEEYQSKVEMLPLVEEEYTRLTLDYENAKRKYDEVLNKLLNAKIAQQMEISQRGERFNMIEKPSYPDLPYKPNRLAIIMLGLVLGVGAGAGMAILFEGLDSSVKKVEEIEEIIGAQVLATVSLFDSPLRKRKRHFRVLVWGSVCVVAVFSTLFITDRFLMPMETIWDIFEDRLVEMGLPIDQQPNKS